MTVRIPVASLKDVRKFYRTSKLRPKNASRR